MAKLYPVICLLLFLLVVPDVASAEGGRRRPDAKKNSAKLLVERFDRDGDKALNAVELTRALIAGQSLIASTSARRTPTRSRAGGRRTTSTGPVRVVRGRRGGQRSRPPASGRLNPLAQTRSIVGTIMGQVSALTGAAVAPPSAGQVAQVLIQRFDRDGSGALSEGELAPAVAALQRLIAAQQMRARSLAPIVVQRGRKAGRRFAARGRRPKRPSVRGGSKPKGGNKN